jgi:hypothetical protein
MKFNALNQPVDSQPGVPLLRANQLEAQALGGDEQRFLVHLTSADYIDILGGILQSQHLAKLLEELIDLSSPGDSVTALCRTSPSYRKGQRLPVNGRHRGLKANALSFI